MATSTGKKARKRFGTRVGAKRSKERANKDRKWGHLPVSASRKNVEEFIRANSGSF